MLKHKKCHYVYINNIDDFNNSYVMKINGCMKSCFHFNKSQHLFSQKQLYSFSNCKNKNIAMRHFGGFGSSNVKKYKVIEKYLFSCNFCCWLYSYFSSMCCSQKTGYYSLALT